MPVAAMTVEDRAFGPTDADADDPTGTWPECVAAFMLPLMVTVALVVVSSYGLCKSIEYQELFQTNPRYRSALLGVNAAVILLATSVVAWSIHAEARARHVKRTSG